MSNVRFELDENGVKELLRSQEMQSILKEHGQEKALSAGEGYESEVHVFQKRAVAHVYAKTLEAKRDNFDNNTLLKVVR